MLISIRHATLYTYDHPARYAVQTLRLYPPSFAAQSVREWTVAAPGIEQAIHFVDSYGNQGALVSRNETHQSIRIEAHGVVETSDYAGVVKGLNDPAPVHIFLRDTPATHISDKIKDLVSEAKGETGLDKLHALKDVIRKYVAFEAGATTPQTTATDALELGKGVCQDQAHIFIAAARAMGIPARYVNGYFHTGSEEPAAAHHAWGEGYVDHLGWVGFDIVNDVCPDDRFVRLATGLDALSASPIRGSRPIPLGVAAVKEDLSVTVEVRDEALRQSQSQQQQSGSEAQSQVQS